MKTLLNIGESILLFITILLTVLSITILNKNFIKFECKKNDYYNKVVNSSSWKVTKPLRDVKKIINNRRF